jgi:hypothetical protein
VDDHFVTELKNIADAFDKHSRSFFDTSCSTVTLSYSAKTEFLSALPFSAAEFSKSMKLLKPAKCVGLCGISCFILRELKNKGNTGIFYDYMIGDTAEVWSYCS